jgi:hypothetical protein
VKGQEEDHEEEKTGTIIMKDKTKNPINPMHQKTNSSELVIL